jgi:hypothetical protein
LALTSAFTTQKKSSTMRAQSRATASAVEGAAVARVDADRLEARRGGALQGGNEQEENEEKVHEEERGRVKVRVSGARGIYVLRMFGEGGERSG